MGKNQDPGSGINIPDPQHCFATSSCKTCCSLLWTIRKYLCMQSVAVLFCFYQNLCFFFFLLVSPCISLFLFFFFVSLCFSLFVLFVYWSVRLMLGSSAYYGLWLSIVYLMALNIYGRLLVRVYSYIKFTLLSLVLLLRAQCVLHMACWFSHGASPYAVRVAQDVLDDHIEMCTKLACPWCPFGARAIVVELALPFPSFSFALNPKWRHAILAQGTLSQNGLKFPHPPTQFQTAFGSTI